MFPNAYNVGFNSGFTMVEALKVAPIDCLLRGQATIEFFRKLHCKTYVSHDKLLLGYRVGYGAKLFMNYCKRTRAREKRRSSNLVALETNSIEDTKIEHPCEDGGSSTKEPKSKVPSKDEIQRGQPTIVQ